MLRRRPAPHACAGEVAREVNVCVAQLHDDEGNILVIVVLVALIIGVLASLALNTGNQATSSSARGRNGEVALAVAEAGAHEAIAKIESLVAADTAPVGAFSFAGSTAEGTYEVEVTRVAQGFVIDAQSRVGGDRLGRSRRVQVSLLPPPVFGEDRSYALFSSTSIDVRNNDAVVGDVWANDSITLRTDTRVDGSLTSAKSWIKLEPRAVVNGNAWSGGFDPVQGNAISLATGASIAGWAKASVSTPTDPQTCFGVPDQSRYDAATSSGSTIGGAVTTFGQVEPAMGTTGTRTEGACTTAAPPLPLPTFTFNRHAYDAATYREFSSVSAFQLWLNNPTNGQNLKGTLVINDSVPSQANRVDLAGTKLAGDATIITNAPIITNAIDDTKITERAVMTIISRYAPPTSTACDASNDASECAVHLKNNFDASCKTSVLVYADRGPSAVKNAQKMCGSIMSQGVLLRNAQMVKFDPAVLRVVGIGPSTYEVARWEECRPWDAAPTEPCDA